MGRVSQVRSLTPNFTVVALKCGLTGVKIAKIAIFGIILRKRGIPLNQFLQNLAWEGLPGSHPHTKFLPLLLTKCGLTAQKITKNGNCWYKFAPKGYIP